MRMSVMMFAALGGFLFGYDTSVINGALFQMKDHFGFDEHSWKYALIVSIAIAGAFVGAFVAGFVASRFGRRPCIACADVLFVVGSVLMAVAPNVATVLVSRAVVGLAIGLSSAIIPVYLAEVTAPRHRGATIVLNTLVLTSAQCIAAGLTALLIVYTDRNVGWRIAVGLGAVPALVQLLGLLLFLPESPRWLMCKGEEELATSVATRFDVDLGEYDNYELHAIDLNYRALLAPHIFGRVVLSSALQIIQQLSGINTIMYYSSVILRDAGFTDDKLPVILSVPLAFMNVLFTIVAILTIDRVGRRLLILLSGLGCLVVTFVVAVVGFFLGNRIPFSTGGWVYMGLLGVFLAAYAPGLGCIPWVVMGEIFPTHLRTSAAAVATMANWGANALVSQVFPMLMGAIGPGGTFSIIAGLMLLSVLYMYFFVVETKGKSLEQLDVMFCARAGVDVTRCGHDDDNDEPHHHRHHDSDSHRPDEDVEHVARRNGDGHTNDKDTHSAREGGRRVHANDNDVDDEEVGDVDKTNASRYGKDGRGDGLVLPSSARATRAHDAQRGRREGSEDNA